MKLMYHLMWMFVQMVILRLVHLCYACPSSCQCQKEGFYTKVSCSSVTIQSILSNLPPATKFIEVTSASGASILSPAIFEGSSVGGITSLTITNSFVQQIEDNTFSSFSNLATLNLTQNRLRTISKNAFSTLSGLQVLDLSQNAIQDIDDKFSPLVQLQKLDLNTNSITSINTGAFRSLVILHDLNLSNNRLQNLHGYVFQGLQSLRSLNLRHCDLHSIASDLFSVLRNVQILDLGKNQIYKLPPSDTLAGLPSLRNLILDHNQISSLSINQFSRLNLRVLNLSANKISSIPSSAFNTFNTRTLDLSDNSISSIAENAFRATATQLENLNMAHNPLGNLPSHVFEGLYRLTYLNLSTCSLIELVDEQFEYLQSLLSLDLSNNHLGYIPSSVVNKFSRLQRLVVYNNPWHCDCHIRSFRDWLNAASVNLNILFCPTSSNLLVSTPACRNLKCVSPSQSSGHAIAGLSDHEVEKCSVDESHQGLSVGVSIAIGISCFLVFGIVVLIVVCVCIRLRGNRPHGSKSHCVCGADSQQSSHKEDREKSTTPFKDVDAGSLNESDKDYVVKRYFRSMVSQPSVVSRGTPSLSHKEFDYNGSCPSLCSVGSVFQGPIGYESTV